jgi:hypothetical protein
MFRFMALLMKGRKCTFVSKAMNRTAYNKLQTRAYGTVREHTERTGLSEQGFS